MSRNVTANVSARNISQQRRSNKVGIWWAVLLRDVSLSTRGRPIRECLSIRARNLAFPQPAERKRRERGGRRKRRKERERDKEKATRGRCGSVAFTECHQGDEGETQ